MTTRVRCALLGWVTRANLPLAMVALLVFPGPTSVLAQENAPTPEPEWHVGGSMGIAGSGAELVSPTYFTVNLHAARARPGRVGVDLAAGTLPRLLVEGVIAVGTRVGATIRMESGDVALWPAAGVSVAGLAAGGGADGLIGGYAGVALTRVPEDGDMGLRIDWTLHQFEGGVLWLLELGFVRRR